MNVATYETDKLSQADWRMGITGRRWVISLHFNGFVARAQFRADKEWHFNGDYRGLCVTREFAFGVGSGRFSLGFLHGFWARG